MPEKYQDHSLSGDFEGYRECHLKPDWLLIYKVVEDALVLSLTRTGTHSDLLDNKRAAALIYLMQQPKNDKGLCFCF